MKFKLALLACCTFPVFGGMTWGLDPTGTITFTGGVSNTPTVSGFEVGSFTSPALAAVCVPDCDLTFTFGPLQSFVTSPLDKWTFAGGSFTIATSGGQYLDINGNHTYDPGTDLTGTLVSGTIGTITLYDVGGTFFFSPDASVTVPSLSASIVNDFNLVSGHYSGSFSLNFAGGSVGPNGSFSSTAINSGVADARFSGGAIIPEPSVGAGAGLIGIAFVLYAFKRTRTRLQ